MKRIATSLLVAASAMGAAIAYSGQMAANLTVTATVIPGCTSITTNALDFGSFTLPQTSVLNGTGGINVTCGVGVPYTVDIDAGLNPGGIAMRRRLVTSSWPTSTSNLIYAIYKDAARTAPWGASDSGTVMNGTGTGSTQALTAYAVIDTFVNASGTGIFTDTVVVTLAF